MPGKKRRDAKLKNNGTAGKDKGNKPAPSGSNILKESAALGYQKRRVTDTSKGGILGKSNHSTNENVVEKNNNSRRGAGSILIQSLQKPESQMTAFEKMDATKTGISKKDLELLKKRAGLDYDQLAHILQVARATLIAKKGSEKFSGLLSEKIMSLADIFSYGYDVFGSEQAFNEWIFQPIIALGGKSPYEILDNVYGREEVKNIIGRIEYGVYS